MLLKRVFDFFISALALWLALPVFVVIAVLIKIGSRGPVFIVQERVGLNGAIFKCYKFRSMVQDAEAKGIKLSGKNDRRVTRVGWFLRTTFLDELPQLFNILVGEMSFVGPRPERPFYHQKFSRVFKKWPRRLLVKPGLAGLAQNFGYDSNVPKKKLAKDLEYVRKQGFLLDLQILAKQFGIAFKNLVKLAAK